MWFEMPYNVYCAPDDAFAAYGAMFNPRSFVGNSITFDNLLQRVSEKRFRSKSEIKGKSLSYFRLIARKIRD